MSKILKYLPGLTGALCAYILLKFISWTGMTYEFVSIMVTYLVVTLLTESAMRSYGKKS
jgi:hypothetical protein